LGVKFFPYVRLHDGPELIYASGLVGPGPPSSFCSVGGAWGRGLKLGLVLFVVGVVDEGIGGVDEGVSVQILEVEGGREVDDLSGPGEVVVVHTLGLLMM